MTAPSFSKYFGNELGDIIYELFVISNITGFII